MIEASSTQEPEESEELLIGRPLTELEGRVLVAAQATAAMQPGPRERHVREVLDLSPTAYYQLLNALLDRPAAREANPGLIRVLSARRHRNRERYW